MKAAGLPNIKGTISFPCIGNATYEDSNGPKFEPNGCFSNSVRIKGLASDYRGGDVYKINFNASDSSSVYSTSDTVQPPAIQLIPQIRF